MIFQNDCINFYCHNDIRLSSFHCSSSIRLYRKSFWMVNIQFVNFTSLPPYGTEHFLLCLLFASFFSYFSGKLLLKCDNYLICVLSLVIFDIFNSFIIMLYFFIPFPGFRISFLLLFLHYFSLCCHFLV